MSNYKQLYLDAECANVLYPYSKIEAISNEDNVSLETLLEQILQKMNSFTPRNLLDNSDFTNPVNQRGSSSYTTGGSYTIDRWVKRNTGTLTVVENEGIKITSVGSFGGIMQPIENGVNRLAGKTVTLAACVLKNPGAFEMKLGNTTKNSAIGIAYGDKSFTGIGIVVSTATLPETLDNGDYLNFFIGEGNAKQTTGTELEIAWCALYEGEYTAETLPKYQPKGYAVELAECQRYFERLKAYTPYRSFGTGAIQTASLCIVPIYYKYKRITTPTITANGNMRIKGADNYEISGLSYAQVGTDSCLVNASITGATIGQAGILQANSDGTAYIDISADL